MTRDARPLPVDVEEVAHLTEQGGTWRTVAQAFRVRPDGVEKALQRHNMPELIARLDRQSGQTANSATSMKLKRQQNGVRSFDGARYRPEKDTVSVPCDVEWCGHRLGVGEIIRGPMLVHDERTAVRFCSWHCVSRYAIRRELHDGDGAA